MRFQNFISQAELLLNEIAANIFQSILQHDLYTFALKPIVEALFSLRLRHLQNMVLNASTASSGNESH